MQVVADTTTAIPGGSGTFGDFGSRGYMAFDGHYAAFRGLGSGGQQGIYSNAGGTLHVVADRTTPVPGGTGTFGGFAEVSADAGNVALFGSAGDQKGIDTTIGGLNVVADKTTPVPDGPGTFTSFRSPAISNENVAFEAGFLDEFGHGRDGIFALYEGSLIKIIDSHYPLDGKMIYNTILSDQALDDNLVSFLANFEDGTSGIFIAVIPEPGTLALLAAGAVILIPGRRSGRRVRGPSASV